jgi:glycosyltransferase involved in cell wall biosynthesis
MKLGIVVFANDSGLGAQTRRLTYMLKPDRILAIDSSVFSKNKSQHFDWYDNFTGYKVSGFPTTREYTTFLKGLTHVIVCENPLNYEMLRVAKNWGIKVFIQSNYEFCDHLDKTITLPHKFLMPSYWKIQEMKDRFGDNRVVYLPPPINPIEFKDVREDNLNREIEIPQFLHIVGTLAVNDRNGTLDLLQALKHTTSDFILTIKSQHDLPSEYVVNDRRVRYKIGNEKENANLYKDFDALILPRRYGGLSLTTNEALMCSLPVIMPDISPNNELLPQEWLVKASKKGEFHTRTMIDIHETDVLSLAKKIDWLTTADLMEMKIQAFKIGYENFSEAVLKSKYEEVLK